MRCGTGVPVKKLSPDVQRELRLFNRYLREYARAPYETMVRWWKWEGFSSREQAWKAAKGQQKLDAAKRAE